ncbi:MAG TPA: LysM peptidoglycan-binding domain-containing protein [Dermatophilaceae bacterium]|nr:LysM peptidoglycan-binding domain-containing protein [Actinomycetales bacterium]HMT90763.1 LysM peptidoglycan-binding domain-containing protein [Dermatophilaceae bacterium]
MSAIAAWELAPVPATSGALRPARHLHVVSAPDRVQEGRSGRHSARGAQGLRLTFAGQIVVAIVAALLVFALAVAVTRVTASSAAPVGPSATVTVERGQTLSQLASVHLPQLSIAEGVAQLRLANGLNSSNVEAGQRLVIPAIG